MTDLTNLESAVLQKLLIGDNLELALLRAQLDVCRCTQREFTGVGFYTYLDVSTYTGTRPEVDLKLGDVIAEIDGFEQGAGFLLYVEDGILVLLEGYTFGEPWPGRIGGFKLSYITGEERDWQALSRLLEQQK